MISYSFKKKIDTGEHHIFEGQFKPQGSNPACSAGNKSVCKKVDNDKTTEWVSLHCLTEQQARESGLS
jgi:hypothetical protein